MSAPDMDAARARHPSSNSGRPTVLPVAGGSAGQGVPALPPWGRDTRALRRQRRQMLCAASVTTLALVVLARVAPVIAIGLAIWVLLALALVGVYVLAFEVGHWWFRRSFERHTAQALHNVRGDR